MLKASFGVSGALALISTLAMSGTAWATSSSAYGVQAGFTFGKTQTGLGPIGDVSGGAPPSYSKTVSVGAFQQSAPVIKGKTGLPTLYVSGASIKSHVTSIGTSAASASAAGDATVKGLTLSLELPGPKPDKEPINYPYLYVTATKLSVQTTLTQVSTQTPEANSTASIAGLVISGSLVDNQTITFTGDLPNDTILFQSDTVTITVNSRLTASVISCRPKCVIFPVLVNGSALDIQLTNAVLDGKTVSGDIAVAGATAGTGVLTPAVAKFAAGK